MKLIETRVFNASSVRVMCIAQDYYTRGTTEEYCALFEKCELNYSVLDIAIDIFEHSNTEKLMAQYGCNEKELLESICYNLINDCTYTLINIEE